MKKQLKDTSYNLLAVRVDCENEPLQLSYLLTIINSYIDNRGWRIEKSSCGHHSSATNKHFHYHCVVSNITAVRLYSSEIYQFNKYLKNEGYNDFPKKSVQYINPYVEVVPTDDALEVIPQDEDIQASIDRWLRYPLKEGSVIYQYCVNIDTEQLKKTAVAHYEYIKELKAKEVLKDEERSLKWNCIVEYLDAKIPAPEPYTLGTLKLIFTELREYTKNESPPVSLKTIADKTITYMSIKKLLNDDQALEIGFRGNSHIFSIMAESKPKQLTKDEQDTIYILKTMTSEQREEMFENLPNGKKLKYYYNL